MIWNKLFKKPINYKPTIKQDFKYSPWVVLFLNTNTRLSWCEYEKLSSKGLTSYDRAILVTRMSNECLLQYISELLDECEYNSRSINDPPITYNDALLGFALPLYLDRMKPKILINRRF